MKNLAETARFWAVALREGRFAHNAISGTDDTHILAEIHYSIADL